MSNWWVDVEDSSGARLGPGPIRPSRWASTARLNRAGEFEFEIPTEDGRGASLCQQKRIVRCYALLNGVVTAVGAGIIEEVSIRIEAGQALRVVRGPDLLSELRRVLVDKRVIAALLSYFYLPTFVNDRQIPYKLIHDWANAKLASAWALANEAASAISSGVDVTAAQIYARFRDESVLNALVRVGEIAGEHFRLGTGRTVEWIGPVGDFTAAGVRAVYGAVSDVSSRADVVAIADVERVEDSLGLINRIIVYGGGEGDTRLRMAGATLWPDGAALSTSPESRVIGGRTYYLARTATSSAVDSTFNCLEDNASVTAYGVHEAVVQFKNVAPVSNTDADLTNASNQLLRSALEWLKRRAEPVESYSLSLAQSPVILRPGQTIRVTARKWVDGVQPIDIDDTLNILEATIGIDADGLRTTAVVVSSGERMAMSDGDVFVSQATEAFTAVAHPQLGPNVDTITYKEDFNASKGAALNFWMGGEISQVQQVLLRFRVDPLRSTVEAASASGDHTHTVNIGNHTHTIDIAGHSHSFGIALGIGAAREVTVEATGFLSHRDGGLGTVFIPTTSTSGTTSPTSSSGGGSAPTSASGGSHIHAMTYGIFEDSGGTTITDPVTQCNWFVNGNAINTSDIDSLGAGWYQIDLTDLAATAYTLVNASTRRPVQAANSVTVLAGVGRRGRITAQLQIRSIIQSVAYS